jgi:hypothetical protein
MWTIKSHQAYSCAKTEPLCVNKCRQCTHNVIKWRIRVTFVPPRLSSKPNTISLDKGKFIAI